jgi:hypothetical protein
MRPICARCCKERIAKGDQCPPECPFFSSDQSYRTQKDTRKYSQRLRREDQLLAAGLADRELDLLLKLEATIRSTVEEHRSVTEPHVLRATDALLEKYRIRAIKLVEPGKVILKQEEIVMNAIETTLDRRTTEPEGRKSEQSRPTYGDEEIVRVLNQLKASIARHQRDGGSYLAFLREFA